MTRNAKDQSRPRYKLDHVKYLAENLVGEVTRVSILSGGAFSAAYHLRCPTKDLVFRLGGLPGLYIGDEYVYKNWGTQLQLARFVSTGQLSQNTWYALTEYVPGALYPENFVNQKLCASLKTVHRTKLGPRKGWGLINSNGAGQYSTWQEFVWAWASSASAEKHPVWWDASTYRSLLTVLGDILDVADEPERSLVHGDFGSDNLIESKNGITILDWGNAIYGDKFFDLAVLDLWNGGDGKVFEMYGENKTENAGRRTVCSLTNAASTMSWYLRQNDKAEHEKHIETIKTTLEKGQQSLKTGGSSQFTVPTQCP